MQEEIIWGRITALFGWYFNDEITDQQLSDELNQYSISKKEDTATLGCGELENENSGV